MNLKYKMKCKMKLKMKLKYKIKMNILMYNAHNYSFLLLERALCIMHNYGIKRWQKFVQNDEEKIDKRS